MWRGPVSIDFAARAWAAGCAAKATLRNDNGSGQVRRSSRAFDFVSFGTPMEHRAYIELDTGRVYCVSELDPIDEEELPEDQIELLPSDDNDERRCDVRG